MAAFQVGVDSYSLGPLKLSAFEVLDWARRHGASGVQFTELNLPRGTALDEDFLRELRAAASERGLYLEWGGGQHIPFNTTTWEPQDLLAINSAAARQAHILGTPILRSCSGGLMRWSAESPPTEVLLDEMARVLRPQRPFFEELDVTLAIELHFEFTTFELLRLFDACGAQPGGYLGICLDTMNLLTMLEDPAQGTERILPWIVAAHVKDGGLHMGHAGLVSFTAPLGEGQVDFPRILALLNTLPGPLNLSVEDHGGSFAIPIFDSAFLSRFPDLTVAELAQLVKLAHAGTRRVAAGSLAPLDRGDWPRHCAERVAHGIGNLKQMVGDLTPPASAS